MSSTLPLGRPRVRRLLYNAARYRAALVFAPCGAGKTTALRDFCDACDAPYVAVEPRDSLLSFVGRLVQLLAPRVPGAERTLAGAYERASQSPDSCAALAGWLARHLAPVRGVTIAVDDLQNAQDPRILAFLIDAVERTPDGTSWVLAGENVREVPLGSWLAREIAALPIVESELRLDLAEATEAAQRLAPGLDAAGVERLHHAAEGVASRFAFNAGAFTAGLSLEEIEAGAADLAERVFFAFAADERDALLGTTALPILADELVAYVVGMAGLEAIARLREKAPFIFEPGDASRYQGRFADFLATRVAPLESRDDIVRRTASVLEGRGDVAGAIRLLRALGDEAALLGTLERHGLAALESGQAFVVRDAAAGLAEETRKRSAAVLTLLAISAAFDGRLDVSESLFQNALACASPQEAWRVRFWYGCELVRRGRGLEAIALLSEKPAQELPPKLEASRACVLAAAHAIGGELERARDLASRALRIALQLGDKTEQARAQHQLAYVALRAGDYRRAKGMALQAVSSAERAGAFDIAGSALTVLYNVVADVDENPGGAAEILRRIAACGAKVGSVEKQFYALVGAYEIEVDRGDGQAAAALESELRNFELQYGAKYANEGLLPSQVLQRAWRGEFETAYRILRASAEEGLDAGRRALRLSEIAVYAACSGKTVPARTALADCRRVVTTAPLDTQVLRARIYMALAVLLLGQCRAASRIAQLALNDIPPDRARLRALVSAVLVLTNWRRGACDETGLFDALAELRRRQFGGVAKLLEALPAACISPLSPALSRGA